MGIPGIRSSFWYASEQRTEETRHMAKKRGNNEGSITRRPDGRWMAQVTIGRDPVTGKPRRAPSTARHARR